MNFIPDFLSVYATTQHAPLDTLGTPHGSIITADMFLVSELGIQSDSSTHWAKRMPGLTRTSRRAQSSPLYDPGARRLKHDAYDAIRRADEAAYDASKASTRRREW